MGKLTLFQLISLDLIFMVHLYILYNFKELDP